MLGEIRVGRGGREGSDIERTNRRSRVLEGQGSAEPELFSATEHLKNDLVKVSVHIYYGN